MRHLVRRLERVIDWVSLRTQRGSRREALLLQPQQRAQTLLAETLAVHGVVLPPASCCLRANANKQKGGANGTPEYSTSEIANAARQN